MEKDEIKKKITEYYYTTEAYFDKLEEVFVERGESALKIGFIDIMSYVRDADRILDVGYGSGALIRFIKKHFPEKTCYGIDLSPIAIDKASKKAQESSLEVIFKVADIEKEAPSFGMGVDLILTHEVVEHLVNPDKAMINMAQLLNKNGVLIIIAPNHFIRAPFMIKLAKVIDYIKMIFNRDYLNPTIVNPPLDILGADSDAVYVSNPWEIQRMITRAGLEIVKKSFLKCRLVARKP